MKAIHNVLKNITAEIRIAMSGLQQGWLVTRQKNILMSSWKQSFPTNH